MVEYSKPLPGIDDDTLPFWEATKRHKLVIQRCKDCGAVYFSASYCTKCDAGFKSPWANNMEWIEASGKGKVFSFVIVYHPWSRAFKDDIPYNMVIIELDEGPWIWGNIVGGKNEDIKVGMPVEVVFDDVTDEVTLPRWKPIE